MALRKYQSVEKAKVVSPEGHRAIGSELRKAGKTSVSELTEDEKKNLAEVDKAQT